MPLTKRHFGLTPSWLDGSYWLYTYDALGQVTGGNRYWSDGTPVAGQQFDYAFDDIGNRKQTKSGGDQNGGFLRVANYSANLLNQVTNRDVSGYVDVKGVSFATNTVTVNSQTAYRKVEYFRKELPVGNTSAALWTNIITADTGQTSVTGKVFVAKSPEIFKYDADGNQTNDGRWVLTWDAENRLLSMTSLANAPGGSKLKLDFAYDCKGRRIQKIVSTNNGSAYVAQSTNKFVYDVWNLLAVLGPSSAILQSFVWGLDLSGSMQGAGGVGGLLAASFYGSATTNCFTAYDGNGNMAALVNANDGTISANYEYGPFGEVIRMTGLMAFINPFRFSTKYQDNETDLLYYGYRFYNSSSGRWLSRDPIEQEGGENQYGFVGNAAIDLFDYLGLCCICKEVSVQFNGKKDFNWEIYVGNGNDGELTRLGAKIDVKWTIDCDDPKGCKFYQNDTGSINGWFSRKKPYKWIEPSSTHGKDNEMPQEYADLLGRKLLKNGYHRSELDVVIVFKCIGSDKKEVQKTATIKGSAIARRRGILPDSLEESTVDQFDFK